MDSEGLFRSRLWALPALSLGFILLSWPVARAQDQVHAFCSLIEAHRPAGSNSCTASLDSTGSFRLNAIVTEAAAGSEVMLTRTDLGPGGSCAAGGFPGLCADLDTDQPVAFAAACSANKSPTFGCQGLYWMLESAPGRAALTAEAERLIDFAQQLEDGDTQVIVASGVAAYVGKATSADEARIRLWDGPTEARRMVAPASAAARVNIEAAISTLRASGASVDQLVLFGTQGRVILDRGDRETFIDPTCSGCGEATVMPASRFATEVARRFGLVPVEGELFANPDAVRSLLMSALVSPGFGAAKLEELGAHQNPAIYLLEPQP